MDNIKELITRRRRQILVHSCIYYRFGTSVISDDKFDKLAYELVELQEKNPEISKSAPFYDDFKDFEGSTGFNLPTGEPWVVDKAYRLIDYCNNKTLGDYLLENSRGFTKEESEKYKESLDEMFKGTGRNLFNLNGG